jgi:hypothetical protein
VNDIGFDQKIVFFTRRSANVAGRSKSANWEKANWS